MVLMGGPARTPSFASPVYTRPAIVCCFEWSCLVDPRKFCSGLMNSSASSGDLLWVVLSILLPPFGVFLQEGIGVQFGLNVLLTLLGYVPGFVHVLWLLTRR